MSMVVRTNTMAMSANSALNKNNSTVAGNLQKLSTGFRINRAADDASGLAVSEKMKAQIKALDQASKNAQDGASLIKTAEGYMGEIHDMLNRIVELAEKSANGTFETKTGEDYGDAATDRQAIQDEVDQLTTEIDRIATTANFNQLKLLDGSLDSAATVTPGEVTYSAATVTAPTSDTYAEGTFEAGKSYERSGTEGNYTYTLSEDTTANSEKTYYTKTPGQAGSDVSELYTKSGEGDDAVYTKASGTAQAGVTYYEKNVGEATTTPGSGTALKLQIGETSNATDKLEVSIMNFKTSSLFSGDGMDSITHTNDSDAAKTAGLTDALTINVSNQDTASVAAEKVRDVINKVSAQRATLGAMENRLDYTMNNLDTASQNITDANSRIRDTDMAKTMMQYTQGNTLTQAAQAMLAQANQAPSQVLQLLQ